MLFFIDADLRYVEKTQKILNDIEKAEEVENKDNTEKVKIIPKSYKRIIDEIESKISEENFEKVKPNLEELKEKLNVNLVESPIYRMFSLYYRVYKRNPFIFIVSLIIFIILYVWLILTMF